MQRFQHVSTTKPIRCTAFAKVISRNRIGLGLHYAVTIYNVDSTCVYLVLTQNYLITILGIF